MAKRKNGPSPGDDALERLPWEQQDGESPRCYAAFSVYRDLGHKRSYRAVVSDMGTLTADTVARWSKNHGWRERVAAYDREQDRITRAANMERAIMMGQRHADEAVELARVALVYPRALLAKLEKDPTAMEALQGDDVEKLYAAALAAMKVWPAIAAAERTARGYSNDTPALPEMADDFSPQTDGDLLNEILEVADVLVDAGKMAPEIRDALRGQS